MTDPIVGIRLAALAAAMRAKVNEASKKDIEILLGRAEAALENGDTLFGAICDFAEQFKIQRYEPPALYQLGADLEEAVRIHSMPTPIDAGRADIYG